MTWFLRIAFAFSFACISCQNDPPKPISEPPPASVPKTPSAAISAPPSAAAVIPAAPAVSASAAPEPAPSATAEPAAEPYCITAAESIEQAKPHQNAAAPYANCAEGIASHCGGGNGERGHLCSKPLDKKATALSRKTKPNTCCYAMD